MDIVNRKDLILKITSETNGEYGHLNASFCYTEPNEPDIPKTIRRTDTYVSDLHRYEFDDLAITCQLGGYAVKENNVAPYGFEARYTPYNVDLSRAERMIHTLRKIGAAINKQQELTGSAKSFGQYVAYAASAFGIKTVLIQNRPDVYKQSGEMWNRYNKIGDAVWAIDARCREVAVELNPALSIAA
jgi:hypothetical protein